MLIHVDYRFGTLRLEVSVDKVYLHKLIAASHRRDIASYNLQYGYRRPLSAKVEIFEARAFSLPYIRFQSGMLRDTPYYGQDPIKCLKQMFDD